MSFLSGLHRCHWGRCSGVLEDLSRQANLTRVLFRQFSNESCRQKLSGCIRLPFAARLVTDIDGVKSQIYTFLPDSCENDLFERYRHPNRNAFFCLPQTWIMMLLQESNHGCVARIPLIYSMIFRAPLYGDP